MLNYIETRDSRVFLLVITLLSVSFSLFQINELSISYKEAYTYYYGDGILHHLTHLSTSLLYQNDFGIKFFFILFNIANIILLYLISKEYLRKESDRNLLLLLYVLSPATISASIIINEAVIIIFCTLLFVYIYQQNQNLSLYLLPIYIFIDNSFFIFYFSLFFFALANKNNRLIIVSLLLFTISMYMYGFSMGGKPKNYFLDTLSIYATLFSPLLFVYIIYSLYKPLIKHQKSIIWYISFIPLIFSLLVSFRQKIYIEDFAPFIILALLIATKSFYNSLRVRLPEFRAKTNMMLYFVLAFLILNLLVVSSNKLLYHFTSEHSKHFAYKHHIVKELAKELKDRNISSIYTDDTKLALRLKFYGIDDTGSYFLSKKPTKNSDKVSIRYINKEIETYFVTKVNKLH